MEEQGDRTGEAGPECTWQEGRSLSEEVQVAWRTRGVAYKMLSPPYSSRENEGLVNAHGERHDMFRTELSGD